MQHPYTGVSYTANNRAYEAIVNAVNACRAEYTKHNAADEMYAEDDAYIVQVLKEFAQHRNVEQLIERIARQDTYVREYYAYICNDLESDYFGGEWE